ncbi:ABC transporter permease [Psychromonas sp.]|nr:ABC transporter permease [Psychromonas sp.]
MNKATLSQWKILRSDKWLLSSLTWLPFLLVLSIWWIFSQGIARDLPIAVVDLQHSNLSRKLINNIDATAALKVSNVYEDALSAKNALVGNDVYAYLIIPKHLDRDIYLGTPPQVSVFYNNQFILVGKVIQSAVLQAAGTFNVQVSAIKELAKGNVALQSAIIKSVTIQTQITPLFNKNSDYSQFLVSAIVPALWQISIVVSCVLFLAANHRHYGLQVLFKQKPLLQLARIAAFYMPFFMFQGLAFLFCFYVLLEWPMNGSIITLLSIQFFTVIACVIMGCFFYCLTLDAARAMSLAGAFSAPSFAFMGITFPASDMNMLAQFWRDLLPISHYIEAQVNQVSYGLNAWQTIASFMPSMMGYLIPLYLIFVLIKKHLHHSEQSLGAENEPL